MLYLRAGVGYDRRISAWPWSLRAFLLRCQVRRPGIHRRRKHSGHQDLFAEVSHLPDLSATEFPRPTIRAGRRELESGGAELGRVRRARTGRPNIGEPPPRPCSVVPTFLHSSTINRSDRQINRLLQGGGPLCSHSTLTAPSTPLTLQSQDHSGLVQVLRSLQHPLPFTHSPTPPAAPSPSLPSGSSSYWKRLDVAVPAYPPSPARQGVASSFRPAPSAAGNPFSSSMWYSTFMVSALPKTMQAPDKVPVRCREPLQDPRAAKGRGLGPHSTGGAPPRGSPPCSSSARRPSPS